jgi:hypothetical protein
LDTTIENAKFLLLQTGPRDSGRREIGVMA